MAQKIKILFAINDLKIGGAQAIVFWQSKFLDKNKFDVYLMTLHGTNQENFVSQIDFLDPEKVIQFNLRDFSLFDVVTLGKIFSFLKREKFDVVYTHLFLTNFIVRILAYLAGVKIIFSFEHSTYFNKKRWQVWSDKILSLITKRIIVSTAAVAKFTAKQERISEVKFVVIPNPVVLPDRTKTAGELKRQIGLPEDVFVIMSLGRFSEEKGFNCFIDAAEVLLKKGLKIYFLLVGYGKLENFLREEIKRKNLGENFLLLREPEKAKELLYLADIFVLPSLREGQAIVIYEAMQAGLPVIASALEGVKDIIINKENGLLVKPADVEELADNCELLYNNKELREELAKNGQQKVKSFTIENNVNTLTKLIIESYEATN